MLLQRSFHGLVFIQNESILHTEGTPQCKQSVQSAGNEENDFWSTIQIQLKTLMELQPKVLSS